MDQPAGSGKRAGSKLARVSKKVKSIFSSRSDSKTSILPSTTTTNRTEVVGGLPIRSAGTNTVLDSFSPTASASTGFEENSTSADGPLITHTLNPIEPPRNTAAITSDSGLDVPESHPPVAPSAPDIIEVTAVGNTPRADDQQSSTSGLSAAPNALPLGETSLAVDVIASDAAVPSAGTIPGSDEPLPNAVGNLSILQMAPAETANGPVTAPGVNSASTDGQTAPLRLWLRAKNAPRWNQALRTLKETNPEMYTELEETKNSSLESRERKIDEFFSPDTAKPQEKAVVQRLKRYLPSLAAVRGVAMAAAAWDPHKIAPIVCACVFFSIDLALNNLSPEDKQKMRNILLESVIAINEWMSFESNFQKKSHDAIQNQVKELEGLLTDYYLEALRLLCDILLSRNGSWGKRLGDKVTNKTVEYDFRLSELKNHKSMWASKKKLIEEKLASEKDIAEVLKWIQQDGDPEKSLKEIESRVTSEGRYPNCAEWILRGKEFQDWSRHWFPEEKQTPSKRMIWVNGPYGTGKTTIIYRVVCELQALSEIYLRREQSEDPADEKQPHRPLRVIPYFCTAWSGESKRVDDKSVLSDESERTGYYSIVIRALAQKISLMPDFTLAQPANEFHGTHTRGLQKPIDIKLWEDFLSRLLEDDAGVSDFVFVIDALDECDSVEEPVNSEKLLEFMRDLIQKFPNIQVLCSSRQHVPVGKYIPDTLLYRADALSAPNNEIQSFIRSEIDSRRNKQQGSVFFKAGCDDIRKRLEQSLIDHAKGMYEWVNIWLKLTIPIHNTRDTVRLRENAEEMLKAIEDSSRKTNDVYEKLKDGYLRLWKLGALKGFDGLRICLFRLIICSFAPLSVDQLTCILQNWTVSDRVYDCISVEEIESLYSNFLVGEVVNQELGFTHNSAREFVMREILGKISGDPQEPLTSLIMKENHRCIAKLFMDFIQRSENRDLVEVLQAYDLHYFRFCGLRHCRYAAEKQSIFDKVWSDMIQRVLRPLESRSDTIIPALEVLRFNEYSYDYGRVTRFIIQRREGKSHFLFSHALVWLGILHDDDVCDRQLRDLKTAPSDTGTREGILRHFAERAAMKSTDAEANALHIACLKDSAAATKLVLKSTYYLYGKDDCTKLLSQKARFPEFLAKSLWWQKRSRAVLGYRTLTPFALAVLNYNELIPAVMRIEDSHQRILIFNVVETLLRFENRYLDTARDKEKANPYPESRKAQQWSHVCDTIWNALTYAVEHFEEESVCRLLKIAGPIAINELDKSGHTPLMTASRMGRLEIMRILVEDYHADLSVRGPGGESALDLAREGNKQAADYLEQRMSSPEPGELAGLSSKENENTS